ncbi:hypothetical protein WISP_134919 [Willisornis vidua]|uniref:RNase H type-1 domain-containing protein n=1 Tax=Willisornis vidua TaxID=1566151 RepID=A0ABQ9CRL7_9PASS|nr:hypothetical protein WISP_134919 [Willisornis vidua]
MKFNKGKYRVLHLGKNNPMCQYRLEADLMESSSGEKGLGVLVDNKSYMIQQCALLANEANGILRCCVRFCTPQYKRDMELLEWVQWRATKMIKELKYLSYEERLI